MLQIDSPTKASRKLPRHSLDTRFEKKLSNDRQHFLDFSKEQAQESVVKRLGKRDTIKTLLSSLLIIQSDRLDDREITTDYVG